MARLIIIPTYNERENIKVLVPRIFKWIEDCSVLIVDDASPDRTGELVQALRSKFPNLNLISRNRKLGLGSAYREGFNWGLNHGFHQLIEMDADMSHRVRDLSKMLSTDPSADLVIGSRWIPGGGTSNWSRNRQLISRAANRYVRFALGIDVKDSTSGFRIYSANLLRMLNLSSIRSEGYSFQIEMTRAALNSGARVKEVPIIFRERESGVSKMSKAIVFEALWLVTLWGIQRFLIRR